VAAEIASPGTPNRTEVMSPVVAATACIPRRKAKASAGDILKMNGNINAKVAAPPMPGRRPTAKPSAMPSIIRLKAFHCKTRNRPSIKASNIVVYALIPRRITLEKSS
jgi:hypothetical protein